MLTKILQNSRFIAKAVPIGGISNNLTKSLCKVEPVQLMIKRNASIHTRHILIQKLRLEHVDNFGVFLMVR